MYYIVLKNKDGVYLLDKSQSLLWKDRDLGIALCTWEDIKQNHKNDNKLYLVHADIDSHERQFLTVIRHY